tara:strand:+ start:1826 stop:2377 length:552 start_codon:yes stop_codon:yes gene_type:complete
MSPVAKDLGEQAALLFPLIVSENGERREESPRAFATGDVWVDIKIALVAPRRPRERDTTPIVIIIIIIIIIIVVISSSITRALFVFSCGRKRVTTDLKKKKKKKRYFDALNQKKSALSLSLLEKHQKERKSGRKNGVGETVAGWDGRFLLRKWKRGDVLLRGFVDREERSERPLDNCFPGETF